MAADLTQAERNYFVRKAGGAPVTERLNNIKRRYMSGVVGAGVSSLTPLNQLERMWLISIVGASPDLSDSDLWIRAVISITQTPTAQINGNKLKFYLNAP